MSGTSNSGQPPQSDASASSTVRDFIYLDEAKIFSYLAQIEGGLKVVRQKVESALDISSTESGGDKKSGSHNGELGVSPAATALAQILTSFVSASISSGLLAGAGGKYSYQKNWETSTDTIKTANHDLASSTDISILHHAAYDLVAKKLGHKLVVVKGKMSLLPIEVVSEMIKEFGSNPEAISAFKMLEHMGASNICFVENANDKINAFLDKQHFLVAPGTIFSTYGSPSEVDFTIVGLFAQNPGRQGKRSSPTQADGQPKLLFTSMNTAFDMAWTTLGVNGGRRIYPIAIYTEV